MLFVCRWQVYCCRLRRRNSWPDCPSDRAATGNTERALQGFRYSFFTVFYNTKFTAVPKALLCLSPRRTIRGCWCRPGLWSHAVSDLWWGLHPEFQSQTSSGLGGPHHCVRGKEADGGTRQGQRPQHLPALLFHRLLQEAQRTERGGRPEEEQVSVGWRNVVCVCVSIRVDDRWGCEPTVLTMDFVHLCVCVCQYEHSEVVVPGDAATDTGSHERALPAHHRQYCQTHWWEAHKNQHHLKMKTSWQVTEFMSQLNLSLLRGVRQVLWSFCCKDSSWHSW